MPASEFLPFQRAKFKTKLPRERLYTVGHMWLRNSQDDIWQVGLTRFALRMLGDPVELEFESKADQPVETGQVVGWLEGFKAVTDLYTPMGGRFMGGNSILDAEISTLNSSSYDRGWLFAVQGDPATDCLDVDGYASFLNATVDRMLGEEDKKEENA
ncbi:MAG: glycine cleavage system H protein [Candidatus Paceibacteria bacterium]|jgi:glycine cleavage system H protein